MRPISVRGKPLAGGALPAVCIPLVARTADALVHEAKAAAAAGADLLEWRVDFFAGIASADAVVDAAHRIKAAGDLPVLFTRRREREGGQPIALGEDAAGRLYEAVAASGAVDLLDTEMANDPAQVALVRDAARVAGCTLVLSFHDFHRTPPVADLVERFRTAHRLGADVGKLAVMPQSPADVLALLQAVEQAGRELPIAVAGMAMGALGTVSRVCGGSFGSALTFAVGQAASAPGQLPIRDLRAALEVLRRSGR